MHRVLPILVLFLLAAAPGQQGATPLRPVKAPADEPGWKAALCREADCTPGKAGDDIALYRTDAGAWWAILDRGPGLLRLTRAGPGRWTIEQAWSFADHQPAVAPSADLGGEPEPLKLFPALYPLGPGRWAVALVSSQTESYSGGGASFETADFVSLTPGGPDGWPPQGVPFSCSKMVRACFSEREYRTSKHCHDEYAGALRFAAQPEPGADYRWTLTWRETDWPAGAAKASPTRSVAASLGVGDSPAARKARLDAFPFCDGGPIG